MRLDARCQEGSLTTSKVVYNISPGNLTNNYDLHSDKHSDNHFRGGR
jgi:hypothetical protein